MTATSTKAARRRAPAAARRRAARPKSVPPPRSSRRPHRRGTSARRELFSIVLLATAVFLAFVVYAGWSGGLLGRWLVEALRSCVGVLIYVVPVVLVYAAVLAASKEERRPRRALTIGIGLLFLATALAAATDAFGLFAGERPSEAFVPGYVATHGGALGEVMWVASSAVVGSLGTYVVIVTTALVAVLLLSGATLGVWARGPALGAGAAGRAARLSATALAERRAAAAGFRRRVVEDEKTVALPRPSSHVGRSPGEAPPESDILMPGIPLDDRPRPARLVDGEIELADMFGQPPPVVTAGPEGAPDEATLDPGDQLTLADEAEAVDDHDTALAFEPPQRHAWQTPDVTVLRRSGPAASESPATIAAVSEKLTETLGHFAIEAWVVGTVSGPRVTRYELQLAPGTKVSRVASLKDDIAYALAATDIRIQAPIPGKSAVGVEVPNRQPSFVSLGDIYGDFPHNASPLAFWLGRDISGKAVLADLARLVHVLIAGTTGSGKSQCINGIISSILLRATPDDVRLVLIDPKKVELSHFDGVPHLLAPVVTQHKAATAVLTNLVHEMERRYEAMLQADNAQNIKELNRKLRRVGERPLPYIVTVVDELADLMMVAPAEVEHAIVRLGQMGRAVGVHLVLATQRPSVDVVTGLIKTNVPSRIAFAVSSQTDSRVILDQGGAESLLGEGDMLFHPYTSSKMLRVQGAMVTPEEMKLITGHWRLQAEPEFSEEILEGAPGEVEGADAAADGDELLPQAMETVVRTGAASVALLQRRLRVGYARAGRLIDIMEGMGIISGYDGSRARNVLIDEDGLARLLGGRGGGAAAPPEDAPAEPAATTPGEVAGDGP